MKNLSGISGFVASTLVGLNGFAVVGGVIAARVVGRYLIECR